MRRSQLSQTCWSDIYLKYYRVGVLSRIACLAWLTGGAGGETDHRIGCLIDVCHRLPLHSDQGGEKVGTWNWTCIARRKSVRKTSDLVKQFTRTNLKLQII